MRRKFTTLCLALVGALMASPAFAQGENVTFKLKNADMEQGLKGWTVDGVDIMSKNKKDVSSRVGFHGMNQGVLETWHYTQPRGDSYAMQHVKGLPNGTYVFGAYVGAASQVRNQTECNHETIQGVSLFANEAVVPVATCNPDLGYNFKWAHSSKFNVAAQVVDGTLEVGLRIEGTNANYVVWDNATLYYFGDMSEEDALDAMAEMDMTNAVAIADTLVSVKMNVDSLANLQTAIATAKAATTTAATLWADNEDLYWWVGKARKSEADYKNLDKDIKAAKVIRGGTWTQGSTPALLLVLDAAIASAEQAYAEAALDRASLTALRKELNWAAGDVKVDSVYAAKDDLVEFMLDVASTLNRPGGNTSVQYESLRSLELELRDTLKSHKKEIDDKLPLAERKVNPNDLIPYIARVYTAIENVKNNPIVVESTKMPIEFKAGADGWIEGAEMYDQSQGVVAYSSPWYRFDGKIENFRITVNKNKKGDRFFCLSGLEFFDGTGAKIELTAADLSTNADHNTMVNGDGVQNTADGGGIPALFDNDAATYFHSAWQNGPSEAHYLEVTLPNGGYDVFSFRMLGRYNGNGWDQSHTFPGEMIISTPMPNRLELENTYASVKNLGAYSANDPGLLKKDFPELNALIAQVGVALQGYPSEDECEEMNDELRKAIAAFQYNTETDIYLPEAGKKYRLISAVPYYDQQYVEKAMTIQGDSCLVWENVCADSLMQEFMFEPLVNEADEPYMEEVTEADESINYIYGYTMKSAKSGLFVELDTVHQSTLVKLNLVKETKDTLRLKFIGRGQWQLIPAKYSDPDHYQLHIQGHGGGSGTSGTIVGWNVDLYKDNQGNVTTALGSASSWYIRELAELPMTVLAENAAEVFKSECVHFAAANTITLKADKDCAFENLVFVDFYGMPIFGELTVEGNTATFIPEHNAVACAFSFTNTEAVASVEFNAYMYIDVKGLLQAAYDETVAFAPIKGTSVARYLDLSEYEAALAYAESLLTGNASDEEMLGAIDVLNEAVANLVPNMPDPNRLYYIISAMDAFKANHGVEMMMYAGDEQPGWTYANMVDANRHWQFVPAEDEEGYYLKNVGTGMYLGNEYKDGGLWMAESTTETAPYTISILHGDTVAIAEVDYSSHRIHANDHSSGRGTSGTIVYWWSGLGTASAWRICEVEAYELGYAMYMYRANAKAGESVKVAVELENPVAVSAVEFDLCLPEGVTLENITLDNVRVTSGYSFSSLLKGNNVCHISLEKNEGALVGYSGAVFNLTLQTASNMEGEYAINLSNIVVTTVDGEEASVADFASSIVVTKSGDATCIDAVETATRIYGVDGAVVVVCDTDMQLGVYTMGGQLVKQWNVMPGKNTMALPAGIYLISGKKVIVK